MPYESTSPTVPVIQKLVLATVSLLLVAASVTALVYIIQADPANQQEIQLEQARSLLEQGAPSDALKIATGILQLEPEHPEAMGIAGMAFAQMGNVSDARRLLEQSLMTKPEQADVAKFLAAIYLARGDAEYGITLLQHAAKYDPDDPRPWVAMGRVYHDLGDVNKAADCYAKAVELDPSNLEARRGRIEEMIFNDRPEEATGWLEEELKRDPSNPLFLSLGARHALKLAQPEQAIDFAEQALEANPDDIEARFALAQSLHFLGQFEQALPELEEVVRLDPFHIQGLNLLAQIEARLGFKERSEKTTTRHRNALDRAVEMDRLSQLILKDPENPVPRYEMGLLAVEGGQRLLAYQCFQAALDVDPQFEEAREELKRLEYQPTQPSTEAP